MKFSDKFWEGTGFADVISHLKSSKSLEFLSSFLSERSALEQDYCKQLLKITKKFESLNESGTILNLFSSVRSEIEKEAELRLKFSQDLKLYSSEIASSAKELKKSQKQNYNEYDKICKEFKSYVSKVSSAQSKYYKVCSDNNQIESKIQREIDSKVQNKLQQSLLKGQKNQALSEQEYQVAVQKQYSFQPQYFQKSETIFDNLQAIEINKKEKIKYAIQNYNMSLKTLEHYVSDSVEFVQESLGETNPQNDINEWITFNMTGPKRPEMPKFIPFTSNHSNSSPIKVSTNEITINRIDKHEPIKETPTHVLIQERVPPPESIQVDSTNTQDEIEEYDEYDYYEYDEEYGEDEEYEYVVAIWDYEATEDNELSFDRGERICVLSKDDEGWWTGQNDAGDVGLFPANHTEPLDVPQSKE